MRHVRGATRTKQMGRRDPVHASPSLVVIRYLAAVTGLVLLIIGVRFLLVPHEAGRFFGIATDDGAAAAALSYVIGLRDIWLALLVIVLSAAEDWRGLAFWLGFGVAVCLGDAAIAAYSSGQLWSVGFHLASGIYCGVLALTCWRQHLRSRPNAADSIA